MITRRQFLTSSLAGLGWMVGGVEGFPGSEEGGLLPDAPKHKTEVFIVRSLSVWNGTRVNKRIIRNMLDEGVAWLKGSNDVSRSWKKLFHRMDTIALKVNPIARHTGSTKPQVCYALAETIHENVGIPYDRFVIFDVSSGDLKGAGYALSSKRGTVQVFATEQYSNFISQGKVKAKISRIITDQCTALVNVPLLKTHKSARISVSLKNHYGSIPKEVVRDDLYRYHTDGFKNLVYLNLMPPIREKTRLIVVDGLMAQYHRGPGGDPRYQWKFGGLILGTDPVAVDTVCLGIINEKRIENSMEPFRLPYLNWARQEGLGTNLVEEILVYEKII